MSEDSLSEKIRKLRKEFDALPQNSDEESELDLIDDFIFTEDEDRAWQAAEPSFTKRIATPQPTKRERRVAILSRLPNA